MIENLPSFYKPVIALINEPGTNRIFPAIGQMIFIKNPVEGAKSNYFAIYSGAFYEPKQLYKWEYLKDVNPNYLPPHIG